MNSVILQMLAAGTADLDEASRAAYRTLLGAGAPANSTTLSRVTSLAPIAKEVITLASFPVTVANTTGASFGGAKVYDFADGKYAVLATADLSFNWAGQDIGATGSGDFSLGTTATADATLSGTDVDLIPSSAMTDPFVAGVGLGVGSSTSLAIIDGTTTAKDAYLNIIIDDADVADAASDIVLVSGTITLYFLKLGDYTAV